MKKAIWFAAMAVSLLITGCSAPCSGPEAENRPINKNMLQQKGPTSSIISSKNQCAKKDDIMIVKLKPEDGPVKNTAILQKYLDAGGTVRLEQPGTYELTGPLLIGSETALEFGPGVIVRRSAEGHRNGPLIVNKGTFSGEWDHHIRIEGLRLVTGLA